MPLEIPALWTPAAVQAQAVAARTYAAYERAHPRASLRHLVLPGLRRLRRRAPRVRRGGRATRHEILRYDGEPAFTQFGSSSGGWTSAGSVPYLPAQADPYDGWSGNPCTTGRARHRRPFESAWPGLGNLQRIVVPSRDGNGEWGGRVRTLRLVGSAPPHRLRRHHALDPRPRSTWVTFEVKPRG